MYFMHKKSEVYPYYKCLEQWFPLNSVNIKILNSDSRDTKTMNLSIRYILWNTSKLMSKNASTKGNR